MDSEVHLFPPEWCDARFTPPPAERAIRTGIYEHTEGRLALSMATADGLLTEMAVSGIHKAAIMGLPWNEPEMCWRNNQYIAETVREHAGTFIGFGVLPPPAKLNLRDGVRRMADEFGLRGLKVIPSWQGFRLNDPLFAPALEELIRQNMVLVPHTDHMFKAPEQSDTAYSLYEVARRYPELGILAPHLGGLLCLYNLHEPLRPALNNIMFITSVPATMKMVSLAVEAVGAERVAFGTDFPFNSPHDQHTVRASLEALGLNQETVRLIAGENVLRFLGELK
jgi:hypothetical protein